MVAEESYDKFPADEGTDKANDPLAAVLDPPPPLSHTEWTSVATETAQHTKGCRFLRDWARNTRTSVEVATRSASEIASYTAVTLWKWSQQGTLEAIGAALAFSIFASITSGIAGFIVLSLLASLFTVVVALTALLFTIAALLAGGLVVVAFVTTAAVMCAAVVAAFFTVCNLTATISAFSVALGCYGSWVACRKLAGLLGWRTDRIVSRQEVVHARNGLGVEEIRAQ